MVHRTQPTLPTREPAKDVRELEKSVRAEGVKGANHLVDILNLVSVNNPSCQKAIHSCRRTIVYLSSHSDEKKFTKWLKHRRRDFLDRIISVLKEAEDEKQVEAAVVGAALTHSEIWKGVLNDVLGAKLVGKVETIVFDLTRRFVDLRVDCLSVIRKGVGDLSRRLLLLGYCGVDVEEKVARSQGPTSKETRKAFQSAWISVLEDPALESKLRKQVLQRISTELIPNMAEPLKLADFLISSYNDVEDLPSMVSSLDSLFVLISKHGLDYPLFYQKLYGLFRPEILFYDEGRARFLELAALVLKRGGMLPGGLIAAFIKRLVRRALLGPPEGAMWCLRLALDLLYRHPNVSYLVHRSVNLFESPSQDASVGEKRKREEEGMDDPYDDEEMDPQESHASESCLWELEVLSNHVSPAVSRIVTLFSRDVRDRKQAPPVGTLEDYAGLTFTDTFNAEFKRRAKSSHLAYETPGTAEVVTTLNKNITCIEWT